MWVFKDQFVDRTGQVVRVGDQVVTVLAGDFQFGKVSRIARYVDQGEDLDCVVYIVLDSGFVTRRDCFVTRRDWSKVLRGRNDI